MIALLQNLPHEHTTTATCDFELMETLEHKQRHKFTDDDKSVVKKLIDAFIVKKQLQQMAS